ncbi:hypothetical protein [Streptomyces gilvosporeus]|uniref:hypothetical protein n=1 Tax=Streptomyces gilvosporeus TaxID=553510 RepID=UPI0034039181
MSAPYRVGDRVDGVTWVPLERRRQERPERFEGATVVQVGSGYDGVDAAEAYVWVRLTDCTERQALAAEVTLSAPVEVPRG